MTALVYRTALVVILFCVAIEKVGAQAPVCPTCLPSGIELVTNGNFEQGNTGFTSSYSYLQGPATVMNEGFYTVINNPNTIHNGFQACADHTTGAGQQMVINGATQTNVTLWCQTITVNPNTDYLFSTWVQSVSPGNPAQLQFSINNTNLGSVFTALSGVCQWGQFYTVWNSGSNTTANICIVNQNTSFGGNDFALDDISFIECVPLQPLNVSVLTADVSCGGTNDGSASPNSGQSWGGVSPYAITWSDGSTGSTLENLAAGNYYMAVVDSVGCRDTAFFTIASPTPFTINLGNDTTSCFGDSIIIKNLALNQPGVSYQWNIPGQTDFLTTIDTTGQYILCGTLEGCTKCDTINVTISPNFTVDIGPPDTTICNGSIGIILNAGNPGASYLWNTGDTTYFINVDSAGLYWVGVTFDSLCTKYDTIQVAETLCTSIVFVPNVFTPDDDGVNDFFFPLVSGVVQSLSMRIFNRWGKEVFYSTDLNLKWDGKIGGTKATDSVYYYILEYVDDKGTTKNLTGTVTLLGSN